MPYMKKELKLLLKEYDNHSKIPARFKQYVNKIQSNHRLIVLDKCRTYFNCHCDNCNKDFLPKGDTLKIIIGQKYKCPYCKKELIVKTNRCHKYEFDDYFAILDKYQDKFIIRAFQVKTYFLNGTYDTFTCEYGRQIYDHTFHEIADVYNDNITSTTSGKWVVYKAFLNDNWRVNCSYYHTLGNCYKLFPYNLKKVLQDTRWQYTQLWDFAKHFDYFYVVNTLHSMNESFELLVKLKLYNLAIDSTDRSDFKNPKEYYPLIKKHLKFCQRYNLNIDELRILKNTDIENIKFIKEYSKFVREELLDEIDLYKADRLTNLNKNNVHEYYDYIRLCKKLNYDLKNRDIKYPKDIIQAHDKTFKLYEVKKDKIINKKIAKRYTEILNNSFQSRKFIIFPAKNINELIDESKQQNNCVKTYAENIASGVCDIYFMRLVSNKNKSLVTVEVRHNRVVQKRTKNNQQTTKDQDKFLDLWERKILKGGM